jgi:hypothetical protein
MAQPEEKVKPMGLHPLIEIEAAEELLVQALTFASVASLTQSAVSTPLMECSQETEASGKACPS